MAAILYLVATPIGNLEDITLRALRVLREEAACIACEDTRQTQKLLDHYGIKKPLVSYHEHNEAARSGELVERMAQGESLALVSDAGTPLISDPGFRLVSAAIEKGFPVVPIPGVSAALAALAASGLPTDQFRFVGFLPAKAGARRRFFEETREEGGTLIAYESPHRIVESLEDLASVAGDRPIALARELTKIHEEFIRGTASEVYQELRKRPSVKGEITLVIGKCESLNQSGDPLSEVELLEKTGMERMEAIKTVAKNHGLGKRELYRMVTEADNSRHRGKG